MSLSQDNPSDQPAAQKKTGSINAAKAAKSSKKPVAKNPPSTQSTRKTGGQASPAGIASMPGQEPIRTNSKTAAESILDNPEPEEAGINPAGNEWNEIEVEEPVEILEDPAIALELTEDPVRLYLKEIGQINLLDADAEFRLAARIEACVRVKALCNHVQPQPGNDNHFRALFVAILNDLTTSWKRLLEDADRMGLKDYPDLALTLAEAQLLRQTWQADEPSYLHNYLDNGLWGKDAIWEGLVRQAFTVFMCMYLLPDKLSTSLFHYVSENETLPDVLWLRRRFPDEKTIVPDNCITQLLSSINNSLQ